MHITKVGYGKTINLGNYENAKYYFEAEINEGENWQTVVEQLNQNIAELDQKEKDVKSLDNKVAQLALREGQIKSRIETAERELEELNSRWKKAAEFLEQHGINPKSYRFEFLPPQQPVTDNPEPESSDVPAWSDSYDDDDDDFDPNDIDEDERYL